MRVIRVADLVGAAREYASGFRSYDNWDAMSDVELEASLPPSVASQPSPSSPSVTEAAMGLPSPKKARQPLKAGKRLA